MKNVFCYTDGRRGIRFKVYRNPPRTVPPCDHIKIEFFGQDEMDSVWIHDEEALAMATGLNKCLMYMALKQIK